MQLVLHGAVVLCTTVAKLSRSSCELLKGGKERGCVCGCTGPCNVQASVSCSFISADHTFCEAMFVGAKHFINIATAQAFQKFHMHVTKPGSPAH